MIFNFCIHITIYHRYCDIAKSCAKFEEVESERQSYCSAKCEHQRRMTKASSRCYEDFFHPSMEVEKKRAILGEEGIEELSNRMTNLNTKMKVRRRLFVY